MIEVILCIVQPQADCNSIAFPALREDVIHFSCCILLLLRGCRSKLAQMREATRGVQQSPGQHQFLVWDNEGRDQGGSVVLNAWKMGQKWGRILC